MQFLQDFIVPAPTQGNLNDASGSQVNETQDEVMTEVEIEQTTSNDESDADVTVASLRVKTPLSHEASTSRSQSLLSTSRPSSEASVVSEAKRRILQKRNAPNLNHEYLQLQKKKVTLLEKEINRGDQPESADLHFFRSLLPYMEHLSLFDKLELRTSIQQLIFKKFQETMTQQQPSVQQKQQVVTPQQPPVRQKLQSDSCPRRPCHLQRESQYDETLTYQELLPVPQNENSNYPNKDTQEEEFNASFHFGF